MSFHCRCGESLAQTRPNIPEATYALVDRIPNRIHSPIESPIMRSERRSIRNGQLLEDVHLEGKCASKDNSEEGPIPPDKCTVEHPALATNSMGTVYSSVLGSRRGIGKGDG